MFTAFYENQEEQSIEFIEKLSLGRVSWKEEFGGGGGNQVNVLIRNHWIFKLNFSEEFLWIVFG